MSPSDSTTTAALAAAEALIAAAAAAALVEAANQLLASMRSMPIHHQRSQYASARSLLMQHQAAFVATFAKALHDDIAADIDEDSGFGGDGRTRAGPNWEVVSLLGGDVIDEQISAERIGRFIGHECESELLELARYMSALLRHGSADPERNPLRADVLGAALNQAIETISEDAAIQKVVAKELGQIFAKAMPGCYRSIIDDLKAREVREAELSVVPAKGSSMFQGPGGGYGDARAPWERSMQGGHFSPGPRNPAALLQSLMHGASTLQALRPPGPPASTPPPSSDAELMALIKRIGAGPGGGERNDAFGFDPTGSACGPSRSDDAGSSSDRALLISSKEPDSGRGGADGGSGGEPVAVNLIRIHRDELIRASNGRLDPMLIEVVGSLFDQILSDSRVPAQVARQIARLQLPVLRVALRDSGFFSSRRHPVRLFINRVSSLGSAFDEFGIGAGEELLHRVSALVTEIVEGDLDRLEVYSEKLLQLETFVVEQAEAEVVESLAYPTLRAKELEWQLNQRFALHLRTALEPLQLPAFVKAFLARTWGQVIIAAAQRYGSESALVKQLRRAGYDLVASIQPQRSAEHRKQFLAALPRLMKTLSDGVALIEWPEPARDAFFGSLISAHAGSLKLPPASDLDHNMLMKRVEAVFRSPLPLAEDLGAEPVPAEPGLVVEPVFTPAEARNVGLLSETAVDWASPVDGVAPAPARYALDIDLDMPDPGPAGATEAQEADLSTPQGDSSSGGNSAGASQGPQLRHQLQLGTSYQVHLQDQWEKLRLTYMSPGRNLFLFTCGTKDRRSISMTVGMLERLCEARRMRAFEGEPLIDRATERARQHLAEQAGVEQGMAAA